MARPETKHGERGAFSPIVLMVGILAIWALIPVKAIESSSRTEQETMAAWAGEGTQRWIKSPAGEMLSPSAKKDNQGGESPEDSDHVALERGVG